VHAVLLGAEVDFEESVVVTADCSAFEVCMRCVPSVKMAMLTGPFEQVGDDAASELHNIWHYSFNKGGTPPNLAVEMPPKPRADLDRRSLGAASFDPHSPTCNHNGSQHSTVHWRRGVSFSLSEAQREEAAAGTKRQLLQIRVMVDGVVMGHCVHDLGVVPMLDTYLSVRTRLHLCHHMSLRPSLLLVTPSHLAFVWTSSQLRTSHRRSSKMESSLSPPKPQAPGTDDSRRPRT
jgi:hypothetical protein